MGRPRKIWPSTRVTELVRLRERGHSWKEIGAKLSIPHVTCSRYWQEVLDRPVSRVPDKRYCQLRRSLQ